jgi:hypothetical protein
MAKTRKPVAAGADSTATDDAATTAIETATDPAAGESAAPESEPGATSDAETVADPVVADVAPAAPTIDPAVPLDEPSIRVVAPAGSRWRGGLQFGREAVTLDASAIATAAAAKGLSPAAFVELLRADPLLSVS